MKTVNNQKDLHSYTNSISQLSIYAFFFGVSFVVFSRPSWIWMNVLYDFYFSCLWSLESSWIEGCVFIEWLQGGLLTVPGVYPFFL